MVDWHCTKGGQWSAEYTLADGRCASFCADRDEKFCGNSPAEAEAKMANDPAIQKQRQQQAESAIQQDQALCTKLGFQQDTGGMANCLLTQQQNRLDLTVKYRQMETELAQAESAARANAARRFSRTDSTPGAVNCTPGLGTFICR